MSAASTSDKPPASASPALLGAVFEREPEPVERAHAEAYAAATNDPNPAYRGAAVPPLLAVRYHIDLAKEFISDPGLEVDLMRLLHGEQDMRFLAPIKLGDSIAPSLKLEGIDQKESGSLIRLRYCLHRNGELVNECFTTYFVRRKGAKKAKKEPSPQIDEPTFTFEMKVRAEQSRDYAEASLDINPIHVMDDFAQMAGFPGVILHGLCSLAFASQGIVQNVADGHPERLASISCRFSKPVLMGETLTTRGKTTAGKDGLIRVEFDVVNQDGVQVITQGSATVR